MGEKSIVLSGDLFLLFFYSSLVIHLFSFIYFVFNSFLCHLFHSSHSTCRFFVALDVLLVVRTFITVGF